MNSRERVVTALNHEEPDRLPIDLGGTVVTSIAKSTYAALRDRLKLPKVPIRTLEPAQQVAVVDDDMIELLGVDVIPVLAGAPSSGPLVIVDEPGGSSSFKDDFGATLRCPKGGFYYDWQEFPLGEPSIDAMWKMPWPDPADPARYRGLRERTLKLCKESDFALFGMAPCGHDLFNQLLRVRGMENGLMDLVAEPEFATAFLERLTDTIITAQTCFLKEVGDLIDIHFTADDFTGQKGPFISPTIYRQMIKPLWARIVAAIKRHTKAKIFYHGCGAIEPFLPDLIEIGIDIINPVQVSAAGMDTAQLKKKYGKRMSYWGGGCDTQRVLPRGTAAEVRAETQRRIRDLAPGGGFVFNPVHNIQPFVPVENIVAMFETAREFRY